MQIEVDGTNGCLRSFAALKKKHNVLKVMLSIGGPGRGCAPFAAVARNSKSRETFARTARELVISLGIDGIDGKVRCDEDLIP